VKIAFLGNWGANYTSESHHAQSLEALGHTVLRYQEPHTTPEKLMTANVDLFIWIKTHGWHTPRIERAIDYFKRSGVPIITYHLDLYLPLPRWEQYQHDPYMLSLDHFFTVDKAMAEWLNEHTAVSGHYLPAGVVESECYVADEPSPHANDVIFVGSRGYHECWPWRPQLIDWLRSTYGSRFTHVGGDGDTGIVRGAELNRVYANSKVSVGDSLCMGFNYPDYWSDRASECMGRSGFLIHPFISGMQDFYRDHEHLRYFTFGDFDGLKTLIDYYLENDEERELIRKQGHELVKANHNYTRRWETILETVFP
jgi:hypothetical protein